MSNITPVSDAEFDEQVLRADLPVLVDFWAPWCMPCQILSPTIDDLASEYAGRVKVVKVNVDDNQALAGKYGIRGIPTLILFQGGETVERIVGVQQKSVLAEKLDKALSG
jgi:thioredoxin 1